jgi:hypothetical protein
MMIDNNVLWDWEARGPRGVWYLTAATAIAAEMMLRRRLRTDCAPPSVPVVEEWLLFAAGEHAVARKVTILREPGEPSVPQWIAVDVHTGTFFDIRSLRLVRVDAEDLAQLGDRERAAFADRDGVHLEVEERGE